MVFVDFIFFLIVILEYFEFLDEFRIRILCK